MGENLEKKVREELRNHLLREDEGGFSSLQIGRHLGTWKVRLLRREPPSPLEVRGSLGAQNIGNS